MKQRIVTAITRPEFWLTGLLLWILISAGRSLGTPWARAALTEALRWCAGIGLALALSCSFRHIQIAARFIVTLIGTLALLGIGDGLRPEHGGVAGPYQDHQLYGSVLLILLPVALAVALTERDFRWRLGAVAAGSMGTLCLFLSQTRSAWIGLLAAALVFGGLWLSHSDDRRRDWRSILVSAAALAGAVLTLWLLIASPDLRAPLSARVGTLTTLSADGSWQRRLAVWQSAARLAAAHPLCGIGVGRYPGAQWAWTQAGHPLTPAERPSLSEEAHDFYLQTAGEIGVIGLGLYGAALTAFVLQGLRGLHQGHRQRLREREALIIAFLSLAAGQSVDALASPSWQFAESSFFFWALLGLGLAAIRGEEPETMTFRFSPALRRIGQFTLSSAATIAVAANILPLGLVTPVEAYTHSSSVSFQKVALAQTTVNCPANSVCFSLTATYSDGSTQVVTFDNDVNGTPAFFGCTIGAGSCSSHFGTGTTRNQLVVVTSEHGKTVTITGKFSDVTYTPPNTYSLTPTFKTTVSIPVTLP